MHQELQEIHGKSCLLPSEMKAKVLFYFQFKRGYFIKLFSPQTLSAGKIMFTCHHDIIVCLNNHFGLCLQFKYN